MPAEEATRVEPQSEADAKMVDLPSDGPSVDVELPKKTEKIINPDPEAEAVETDVKVEQETASSEEMDDYGKKVQSRIDKSFSSSANLRFGISVIIFLQVLCFLFHNCIGFKLTYGFVILIPTR